jgi:drug/metabolite transporter (DMT)-like permease
LKLADLGLLYCAAVWGATFFMVKDSLASVDPVVLVAYRFLIAAAALLPWALRRKRLSAHLGESALLSAILATLYISQTIGLKHTTASNSGFITGLFVIFVPIFILLFRGVKPTRMQWFASGLALVGLWILTGRSASFNKGDALTIVSAMTYAAHLLATDTYVRGDADMVLLSFHQFWMTGLACLTLALTLGVPLGVAGAKTWYVIGFLALVPTLSAFFVQMVAQRVTTPIKVSLIFSLEPVFAAIFAWTAGAEPFFAARAAGGALIVAAMIADEVSKLDLLRGRRKEVLPV